MTLRHALVAALLLAALGAPAGAAPSTARPAARAPRSAARRAAAGSRAGRAVAADRTGEAARRLEDIHIEGEIPVPQVLFITARDQRRFLEFQHGRYLKTSRTLGEETPLPAWIVVTGVRPAENQGSSR
jgi:hypothetical protein